MYLLRKCAYRDIQHIIRKHTEQYGANITRTLTEVRGGGKVMVVRNLIKTFLGGGGGRLDL